MAKFSGPVGFVGQAVETEPGVYEETVIEKTYFGDVIRNTLQVRDGEKVNRDISVNNSISILADAYASNHFFAIRYVKWQGVLWSVNSVDVQSPRLLLSLGEVYNGPTPSAELPSSGSSG